MPSYSVEPWSATRGIVVGGDRALALQNFLNDHSQGGRFVQAIKAGDSGDVLLVFEHLESEKV